MDRDSNNVPGNIGTYQFFTVIGLALFGVDKTLATFLETLCASFAVLSHLAVKDLRSISTAETQAMQGKRRADLHLRISLKECN